MRSGIGVVEQFGCCMNVGDLPIIEAEMPTRDAVDAGAIAWRMTVAAQLEQLEEGYERRQAAHQCQYRGWGLNFRGAGARARAGKGRVAPPAGSTESGEVMAEVMRDPDGNLWEERGEVV